MGRLPHAYLVFYFTQKEVRYVNESIINDNTTHDPEDYEAIHDHLADEDDIYNESYIISKKNYEINMDKWKPGTPLWITGSSGDGKSTYANQLAKEKKAFLVPLDLFLVRIAKPKEKYDKFLKDTSGTVVSNGSQMILDYINKHPEIPWADPNSKGNWGKSGQDPELWNGLFDWLIDASAKNPKYKTKLIIFEGCNICLMPVEKAVKFPFIIMGTSRLQSSIRRIKRDKKEHDDYSIFKLVYRELKRSTKGVLPSLNKTKDNFEKGLKKQMKTINESSNVLMSNDEFFMESQATRNKVLERLDYDPKTQTIDTGIKKKNGDHIRVKFRIGTDTAGKTEIPTSSKAYSDIDDYLKDVKIIMGRKYVNQKNNAPLATVYHEIGHIAVALTREYPQEIDGSTKELLDKIRKHVANSYDDIKQATLNDHDSSLEEHHADTYGTTKTSGHANRKSIEKIYNQHINDAYADYKKAKKLLEQIKNRKELSNEERKKIRETERDLDDQIFDLKDEIKNLDTKLDDDTLTEDEANRILDKIDEFNKNIKSIEKTQESLRKRVTQSEYRVKNDLHYAGVMHDRAKDGMRLRSNIPSSFKESYDCLIMDNEEFFAEAKSTFKQDMRKVKVEDNRKAGTNKSNDNKNILKEYIKFLKAMEKFKAYRYNINLSHNEGRITFMSTRDLLSILESYDNRKVVNNAFHGVSSKDLPINLEEFDVKKYNAFYKEIKNLVDQFIKLSDIKEANKDIMHIKSLRDKIFSLATDLSKSEIESKMVEIQTDWGEITLHWFPSSYRKIDTKNYHLFVHRSDITNLTELIPQMFQENKKFIGNSRTIRIYRDAVVHFWAFKKTNDPTEIARQIKAMNEGGYIFGNNFYIYEPKNTDVFYIDGNYDYINDKERGERYVDPFSNELVPVTIVTKTPLKIKKTSLEEIKKMIGYKTGDIKQIFDNEEASDKINEKAPSDISLTDAIERNNDSSSSRSSSSSYSRYSSTNTEDRINRRNEALYKKSKDAGKPVQAVSNDKLKSLLANKKKPATVHESYDCLIMDNEEFFGLTK